LVFQILGFLLDMLGYQFAVGQDIMHFFDTEKVITNCMGYLEIEKVGAQKLKNESFYKLGIMNVRKLRQIPRLIFGYYFWQDIDSTDAIEQFKVIDNTFTSENDVIEYVNEWSSGRISRNKPQWEIRFVEDYTDTTSLILVKCHHSLTDGIGIISLFSLLNDGSYHPKNVPKFRGFSIWQKLMVSIFVPMALIMQCSVTLFFKLKDCNRIIHTPDRKNTGDNVFLTTPLYDFADLRKCYKKFDKVTFNNFLMGIVGKSIHQWYAKNGVDEPGSLIVSCPVSMKGFPESIKDVNLNNCTSAVTVQLPIVNDLKQAIYTSKERFAKHFKLPTLIAALEFQKFFSLVPPGIGKALYTIFTQDIDLVLTNVSGTKEPLYI
jgi:NRPS condensation-like uncharacterized protein